jgi:hypothetical protein
MKPPIVFPNVTIPRKINYSFNVGQWHFVILSWPGLSGSGINDYLERYHPEYYTWLENDLKANSAQFGIYRPTMFFTHHPILPAGEPAAASYGGNATVRNKLANNPELPMET